MDGEESLLIDLERLGECARSLGLSSERVSVDRFDVHFGGSAILTFKNIPDEDDNVFGFGSTPWHTHDRLSWITDAGELAEYQPEDVLLGLACGELVVVSRYQNDRLVDIWISHMDGLSDIELGSPCEEIRARRVG